MLAYSNSSARGRAFLKHLTDLSIRGTLFVPQNSGLMEKTVSGVRGACTFRRDVFCHHSVSQITPEHESTCLSFTGEVTVQDPIRAKQQSLPQIQRGTGPHQHTQMMEQLLLPISAARSPGWPVGSSALQVLRTKQTNLVTAGSKGAAHKPTIDGAGQSSGHVC